MKRASSMLFVASLAFLAGSAVAHGKEVDPFGQPHETTPERQEREMRNESYDHGYRDGLEAGKEAQRDMERATRALQKGLDESGKIGDLINK